MQDQPLSPFDTEQEIVDLPGDYTTPEQSMLGGEKLTLKRRKKRLSANIIRQMIVMMVAAMGIMFISSFGPTFVHGLVSRSNRDFQQPQPNTASVFNQPPAQNIQVSDISGKHTFSISDQFSISGRPTIIINNLNQDIHITAGADNEITVSETEPQSKLNDCNFQGYGNQVELGCVYLDYQPPNLSGELDVTVPTIVGVSVKNISGSGNIFINGVTGPINVETGNGNIQIEQTNIVAGLQLFSHNGNIRFSGTINPYSNANIMAENGSVSLTLPSNAAFYLLNTIGTLKNDFQSNSVGSGPQANLIIEVQNGDITIQKAAAA